VLPRTTKLIQERVGPGEREAKGRAKGRGREQRGKKRGGTGTTGAEAFPH